MLEGPLLLAPLLLAGLLLLSGVAKVADPDSTRSAVEQLRLPAVLGGPAVPRLLPWAEIALALALVALPSPGSLVAAGATGALMALYLGLVVRALGFSEPISCGCFGALGLGEITRATAVRNALLVLAAGLAVVAATAPESVLARLGHAPPTTWAWLGMSALTAAILVLALGGTDRDEVARATGEDDLDYRRQPLPHAGLESPLGVTRSLHDLASEGATLLVFVSPGCGACLPVAARLPEWAAGLAPVRVLAVTSAPRDEIERSLPDAAHLTWHDPAGSARSIFGVRTPGAVLLGADGLLAGGPVQGRDEVTAFAADIRAQLVEGGVLDAEDMTLTDQ